jgi:hypothetical protein
MEHASQAIAEGKGFQLIADLIETLLKSGLSERASVHEVVLILDHLQRKDEESALILIKHLKQYMNAQLV